MCQKPWSLNRWVRFLAVLYLPNFSGISRHRFLVVKTHKMPSKRARHKSDGRLCRFTLSLALVAVLASPIGGALGGEIDWAHLTWEQNPTQYQIVNALEGLPIVAYLPAMVTKGSANLSLPERWTRTLG